MVMAVAITTAPRPHQTLETSLLSLRQAGYGEPVTIVADGVCPVRETQRGIDITVLSPRRGIVGTWAQAVRVLLGTSAEFLMVMQDDVTWPVGGWASALGSLSVISKQDPQFGYASLHTMPRVEAALRDSQSLPVTASWFETGSVRRYLHKERWCGAQCWVLPRASASHLLADPEFRLFMQDNTRGFDHQVTLTLNRMGHRTYTWWPSLLSHDLGKGNRAPRQRAVA